MADVLSAAEAPCQLPVLTRVDTSCPAKPTEVQRASPPHHHSVGVDHGPAISEGMPVKRYREHVQRGAVGKPAVESGIDEIWGALTARRTGYLHLPLTLQRRKSMFQVVRLPLVVVIEKGDISRLRQTHPNPY